MSGMDEQIQEKEYFNGHWFSRKYKEIATCRDCDKIHLTYHLYCDGVHIGHLNCTNSYVGPNYKMYDGWALEDVTDIVSKCNPAVQCSRGDLLFTRFMNLVK